MDELSFDEANRIIRDKSHPSYARYQNFDPDVHGAVTAALLRGLPGTIDITSDVPVALRDPAPKPGNPQAGSEQADDPRTAALQESLRRDPEFGAAYEQNMARAQAAHAKLFGDRAQEIAAQVDETYTEAEKIQAIKLLAKLEG